MPEAENNQLTDREQEILELVATGVTNKEIAQQLSISVNTVKVHLRNIFSKLDVASRTEATMYAVQMGLVQPHLDGDTGEGVSADILFRAKEYPARWWQRPWFIGILAIIVIVVGGAVGITLAQRGSTNNGSGLNPPQAIKQERWERLADMPTPRMGHAVAVYEDQIYVVGGRSQDVVLNSLENYDPESDTWTQRSSKPTPVTDIQADVIGGLIFVPGGRLADGTPTDILEVYDPQEDVWEQRASLPTSLSGYALEAYEGSLYLFGGWDGNEYMNSTLSYDPNDDEWTELTPMPTKRAFAGAVEAGGKIYVVGGFDGERPLNVSEGYLPENDDGVNSPWSIEQPLPSGRYAMGVTKVANFIYLFGGRGPDQDFAIFQFNPQQELWEQLGSPFEKTWVSMGVITLGSQLFALGGDSGGGATQQSWRYQAIYTIGIPVLQNE